MTNRRLISGLALILAGGIGLATAAFILPEYLADRQLRGADIKSKIESSSSLKEIGGFYDQNGQLSKIVVKSSYFPFDIGPITSDISIYTSSNKEFKIYSKILSNSIPKRL